MFGAAVQTERDHVLGASMDYHPGQVVRGERGEGEEEGEGEGEGGDEVLAVVCTYGVHPSAWPQIATRICSLLARRLHSIPQQPECTGSSYPCC